MVKQQKQQLMMLDKKLGQSLNCQIIIKYKERNDKQLTSFLFFATLILSYYWTGDFLEHYFTNNQNLRSEIRSLDFENEGQVFTFFSDLGVFSKNHIDYGSRLLLKNIIKNVKEVHSLLDIGCGYGFLGIVLGRFYNVSVSLTDVNKRALHLCEKNLALNKVKGAAWLSDGLENVQDSYDLIVTNPPIRAGKKTVLNILRDAYYHLNKNGELWFVIRKDQGVKTIMRDISDLYQMEIMAKDKGFYIVRAKTVDKG